MRLTLAITAVLVAAPWALADAETDARVAWAWAEAEQRAKEVKPQPKPKPPQPDPFAEPTYGELRALAIARGLPLVVSVGCDHIAPVGVASNWLCCRVETFGGVQAPAVVVSRPQGNDLYWLKTLPAGATAADVGAVLSNGAGTSADASSAGGWTAAPQPTFHNPYQFSPVWQPMYGGGRGGGSC